MTTTHSAELNGGIWTSWLPVTTSWTSQSACNSVAWARYGIQPSESFWPYIYDPAYGQSVANTLTCLPPEATQWWDGDSTVSNTITRWSIGPIVCPAAYATVSTSIISDISTSIICCPRYIFQSHQFFKPHFWNLIDLNTHAVTSTSFAIFPRTVGLTVYAHQP
jgi:hypothetical protein